ncbi:signal peptidase II [Maribacter sp. TH_r10]|uniref:Lipoprotein signal peptidase n=1 Tax=Maribacter luteus TaxID=2594478 RepID=A0A6I2MTX5_9FLAO|nr:MULTISPECIES: signal peptidase II [Maribacter]MDV7138668.1 signal peptidase II [Maribacter sp. TH_r10]MRX65960.1 signal peptidase II [Maribacter luteus]
MLKRISIILIVLLNVGCDQLSKDLVRKHVEPMDYIQVVNDNFILTNVENTGAMLGFGQDFPPILKRIFLQGLPLIVLLVLMARTLQKANLNRWMVLAFAFVIGGGIGNLIDRIAYGSVTDFFQVKFGFFKTGIFNMADVSVSIGVFLLLFVTLRYRNLSI